MFCVGYLLHHSPFVKLDFHLNHSVLSGVFSPLSSSVCRFQQHCFPLLNLGRNCHFLQPSVSHLSCFHKGWLTKCWYNVNWGGGVWHGNTIKSSTSLYWHKQTDSYTLQNYTEEYSIIYCLHRKSINKKHQKRLKVCPSFMARIVIIMPEFMPELFWSVSTTSVDYSLASSSHRAVIVQITPEECYPIISSACNIAGGGSLWHAWLSKSSHGQQIG